MGFDKELVPNMNIAGDEKKYEEWSRKFIEYSVSGNPKLEKVLKQAEKAEASIDEATKLKMAESMGISLSEFETWNGKYLVSSTNIQMGQAMEL